MDINYLALRDLHLTSFGTLLTCSTPLVISTLGKLVGLRNVSSVTALSGASSKSSISSVVLISHSLINSSILFTSFMRKKSQYLLIVLRRQDSKFVTQENKKFRGGKRLASNWGPDCSLIFLIIYRPLYG
jgi:hypothetical protein